jgi:hypothetical protein
MAKDFIYKILNNNECVDKCIGPCTYPSHNNGYAVHIGSSACQECDHYIGGVSHLNTITCPKIMRRSQITEKVIFLKK